MSNAEAERDKWKGKYENVAHEFVQLKEKSWENANSINQINDIKLDLKNMCKEKAQLQEQLGENEQSLLMFKEKYAEAVMQVVGIGFLIFGRMRKRRGGLGKWKRGIIV